MCLLVLITYGHIFISGQGSWFHKACYYDCGSKPHSYFDRVYRVDPDGYCPVTLRFA